MMALRVYGPLLWSRRTLLLMMFVTLQLAILFGVASGGVVGRINDLREMAASTEEFRMMALKRAMRFTLLLGGMCGFLMLLAGFELQRMHASWGFAFVRSGLRGGLVIGAAFVAVFGGGVTALWLPPVATAQSALAGLVGFGLVIGSGYAPALRSHVKAAALLPIGTLCLTFLGAPWMVAASGFLGVAGMALLAAACVALALWTTSADVHRRVIHLEWPSATDRSDVADAAAAEAAQRPPHGVVPWLLRLEEESSSFASLRRFVPLPSMLRFAAGTAAFAAWIYATDTGLGLFAIIVMQRTLKVSQPVPYPLSRRDRAKLQFAEQTMVMLVGATVAAMVTAGLSWMDVPRFPWFSDGDPPTLPPAVLFAAIFALLPIGQLGRPWAPLGELPEWRGHHMLLAFLPFFAQVVLSALLARSAWRLSGEDVATAITACVVLGVVLQALSYPYVQYVFARRDLVHRRR